MEKLGKRSEAVRRRLEQVTVAQLSWNANTDQYGRDTRAMLAVHGMDPDGPMPGIHEFRNRKHPDDVGRCAEEVRSAVVHRLPMRQAFRMWPDTGGERVLVALADPVMTSSGLILDGYFADVTPFAIGHAGLGLDAMRQRADQLRQGQRQRVMIEQAKGAIMELYHCDADLAWRVLRDCSQRLNIKVRLVADQFVSWLTCPDGVGGDWGHVAATVQIAARDLGLSMRHPN